MAAALTAALSEGRVKVRSAGSEPAEAINPTVVEVMSEMGLDIWTASRNLEVDQPLALGGHGALDQLEVVEGNAGAHGDAFEGVVGDVAGDADLLGDQAVGLPAKRRLLKRQKGSSVGGPCSMAGTKSAGQLPFSEPVETRVRS